VTTVVAARATVIVCNTCGATTRAERTSDVIEATAAVDHMERAVSQGWAIGDERSDADQCPTCAAGVTSRKASGVFRIARASTDAEKPAPSMASRVRDLLAEHYDDTESPT